MLKTLKKSVRGIDFNLIRPWIFCIESTEPYTKIPTYNQWEDILFDNDYYLLLRDGVNSYYADIDKKELFESKNIEDFNEKYEGNVYIALEKTSKLYNLIRFTRKHFINITDLYYRIRFRKF